MKFKVAVLFVIFLSTTFVSSFGFSYSQHIEIINGRVVKAGESYAKHTVGVGDENEMMCTGVVIDDHFVLTAAHCKADVINGSVFFGTNKSNMVQRRIVNVTIHPQYCSDNNCGTLDTYDNNDILLVQFDGNLPEGYAAVRVAPQSFLHPGALIHLAGFGMDELHKYSDIMKTAKVPFAKMVGQSEFMTDERRAGSCSGDSGGPAYIEISGELLLAGITSRGDGNCRRLGIYAAVDYFSLWIRDVIASSK